MKTVHVGAGGAGVGATPSGISDMFSIDVCFPIYIQLMFDRSPIDYTFIGCLIIVRSVFIGSSAKFRWMSDVGWENETIENISGPPMQGVNPAGQE